MNDLRPGAQASCLLINFFVSAVGVEAGGTPALPVSALRPSSF